MVERVPIEIPPLEENERYLRTKEGENGAPLAQYQMISGVKTTVRGGVTPALYNQSLGNDKKCFGGKAVTKVYEGQLLGEGLKFAIVISRFNEFITRKLLDGAMDALTRHGVNPDDVEVVWVPGAFEMPLVAQTMTRKPVDAVICLGAVIRGATPILSMYRRK